MAWWWRAKILAAGGVTARGVDILAKISGNERRVHHPQCTNVQSYERPRATSPTTVNVTTYTWAYGLAILNFLALRAQTRGHRTHRTCVQSLIVGRDEIKAPDLFVSKSDGNNLCRIGRLGSCRRRWCFSEAVMGGVQRLGIGCVCCPLKLSSLFGSCVGLQWSLSPLCFEILGVSGSVGLDIWWHQVFDPYSTQ